MNQLAPEYLCSLVVPEKHARSLRSHVVEMLEMSKARFKTYGDRSFMNAAAVERNELPLNIRKSPSVDFLKGTS